jgi:hypothetical protein
MLTSMIIVIKPGPEVNPAIGPGPSSTRINSEKLKK